MDAGSYPCRGAGDIGWQYTYVVVLGDDGEIGGNLYSHIEELGFNLDSQEDRWILESPEDSWTSTVGRTQDIRILLGSVERWREYGSTIGRGPPSPEVERAVAGWEGPAALIGFEPLDETCEI